MKKFLLVILISFLLTSFVGCANTYDLDPKWAPLVRVIETGNLPGFGNTVTATISPNLFTENLESWLERNPPNSLRFNALLHHELTHAKSQEAYPAGKTMWLYNYLSRSDFRLEEEKAGYRAQIEYLLQNGQYVNPVGFAEAMSGSTYNDMVDYQTALVWVKSVISSYKPNRN